MCMVLRMRLEGRAGARFRRAGGWQRCGEHFLVPRDAGTFGRTRLLGTQPIAEGPICVRGWTAG